MLQKTLNHCYLNHFNLNSSHLISSNIKSKKVNVEVYFSNLLLEDEGLFLLEDGNYILLE